MPFLPLKATTSLPALDLALAPERGFRSCRRFPLLLFFRAADFFPVSSACSKRCQAVLFFRSALPCPARFVLRFQRTRGSGSAVPARLDAHHLLDDAEWGAYSRGSSPLFSVRYKFHAFREDGRTRLPQVKLPE